MKEVLEDLENNCEVLIQRNKDGVYKLDMRKVYDTLGLIKKCMEEQLKKFKFNYRIAKEIGKKYELPMKMDLPPWIGMISHEKSLMTIFGHKHKIKNFIKKFDIFHRKF